MGDAAGSLITALDRLAARLRTTAQYLALGELPGNHCPVKKISRTSRTA